MFDRRGFIRRKGRSTNPKTAKQGNARQAMTAAQRCIKICGPETRQRLRAVAKPASQWSPYLTGQLLGPKRAHFLERQARYQGEDIDQAAWETAAEDIGMTPVQIDYATDEPVSPGTQLFMLASTLHDFDIYPELGNPAGTGNPTSDVEGWTQSIIS